MCPISDNIDEPEKKLSESEPKVQSSVTTNLHCKSTFNRHVLKSVIKCVPIIYN